MKLLNTRASLPPLILVVCAVLATGIAAAASGPLHRVDLRQTRPTHGDPAAGKATSAVCAACHGANGVAVVPQFPSLAGQSATYLYVQMRAFKRGWRDNAVMKAQTASLDDRAMRNLAAYYASLPPKQSGHAKAADSRGAALYHEGDPAQGIPACQGCHGIDGQGPHPDPDSTAPQPAWSTFPALAGQSATYMIEQLKAYKNGTRNGSTNTAIMHGVVQNLGEEDMQAVATYLSRM